MENPIRLIHDFILETEVAIRIFELKKVEIENHHKNCNISRTIGTSISTAGAGLIVGALVLAPFTGGTSIVAATGMGTLLGIGGATVSVGTEVYDFFASKNFTEQITEIFEKRNKIGEKLAKFFKEIETISSRLLEEGMDEDEAAATSTFFVLKRGMNSVNFFRFHNLGSFAKATSGINFSIRAGGQFWRSMRLQSQYIRKILNNLGINVGRKAAMNAIRTGTVVLSAVFVYFDVKSLIDSWTKKHPNLAQIEEVEESIKNQLTDLRNLYEWLNEIPDDLNKSKNEMPGDLNKSGNEMPGDLNKSGNEIPCDLNKSNNEMPDIIQDKENNS